MVIFFYSHYHRNDVKPTPTVNGSVNNNADVRKNKKNTFVINIKNKKTKESCDVPDKGSVKTDNVLTEKEKLKKPSGKHSFTLSLKQTLCNIFRIRKLPSPDHTITKKEPVSHQPKPVYDSAKISNGTISTEVKAPFLRRALPPLPAVCSNNAVELDGTDSTPMPSPEEVPFANDEEEAELPPEELSMDFASSIEKVKDVSIPCLCFKLSVILFLIFRREIFYLHVKVFPSQLSNTVYIICNA